MSATCELKPARPGLIVRDPASGEPLPAQGAAKPLTQYWLRRLRQGDVIDVPGKGQKGGK